MKWYGSGRMNIVFTPDKWEDCLCKLGLSKRVIRLIRGVILAYYSRPKKNIRGYPRLHSNDEFDKVRIVESILIGHKTYRLYRRFDGNNRHLVMRLSPSDDDKLRPFQRP